MPALVAAVARAWPAVFTGDDREELEALCRQVDVRKKVSAGYDAGVEATRSRSAGRPCGRERRRRGAARQRGGRGRTGHRRARNDGWGLKCTNSALKALELRDDLPHASELRVWAIDVLDRMRDAEEPR